jgi:hypothetical protein
LEQAKQIEKRRRDHERRQREKMRFEWQQEKMEWARQKEADRRADLEYKRAQRGKEAGSEKQRKAEFEKQQAREDLEHYSVQREDLQRLYGTYENRFRLAKNTKQAAAAYKQMIDTDNKLRAVDKRIAKAEYIIAG